MANVRDPERDQPAPKPGKVQVHQYLVRALLEREQYGAKKYGLALSTDNGRNFLFDLWEEMMDGLCYLTGALIEQGATLPGVPIPEGHPAYSLVQDLIEGDAEAQRTAEERLGKGVPRCNSCNQVTSRTSVEIAADLERLNWTFAALRGLAQGRQAEAGTVAEPDLMTDADTIWPSEILAILGGKLAPGIEV